MDSAAASRGTGRRLDLDLIRAAIVAGLTFFHTACIFRAEKFYVNNPQPSFLLTGAVFFAQLWGMPLMFMVAGGGVFHSLQARTAGAFVQERLRRLLLPLVVGVVVVVPPQIWYAVRADGQEPGSFWQFLGRFFAVRPGFRPPWVVTAAGSDSLFDAAHLWFLYYLLAYSLLLLPVFLFLLPDRAPARGGARLVALCQRPRGVLALAGPLVLLETLVGTWGAGGWNSFAYLFFLLYGFLMAANRQLREAIRRSWPQALALGVLVLPLLFVIARHDLGGGRDLGADPGPWSMLWRLLKATGGWAWTVAILGLVPLVVRRLADRWIPAATGDPRPAAGEGRWTRLARYANEAVLPFYVLHQTSIVIIGYYVVQWSTGVLPKFLVISGTALVVTFIVYDLGVRRTRLTRVLFGMRTVQARAVPRDGGIPADRR
jgi:acyltransferase-like protein